MAAKTFVFIFVDNIHDFLGECVKYFDSYAFPVCAFEEDCKTFRKATELFEEKWRTSPDQIFKEVRMVPEDINPQFKVTEDIEPVIVRWDDGYFCFYVARHIEGISRY